MLKQKLILQLFNTTCGNGKNHTAPPSRKNAPHPLETTGHTSYNCLNHGKIAQIWGLIMGKKLLSRVELSKTIIVILHNYFIRRSTIESKQNKGVRCINFLPVNQCYL